MIRLVIVVGIMLAASARADEVAGPARVIDGGALEIAGTKIRLDGIRAPGLERICMGENRRLWSCGAAAEAELKRATAHKTVTCRGTDQDAEGHLLAACYAEGRPALLINRHLVQEGLAWAWPPQASAYAEAEREARRAKRGIFAAENAPAQ